MRTESRRDLNLLLPRAAIALLLTTAPALADDPSNEATAEASLLSQLASGSDLLDSVPAIGFLDGPWSVALHGATLLVTRNWDAPYPDGLIAHASTRILYGTTWSTMLALESLAVALASEGRFDWLAEAVYRSDFTFGVDGASCPRPGAYGGCGIGMGGYGGIYVRPVGSRVWYEATGGWLEQRVRTDARGTLAESVWVLAPFTVTVDVEAKTGPFGLGLRAGPGIYFGMHNAHFHPAREHARASDEPWNELHPIDYGVGPGARVEARVILLRRLSFDAEVVVAPLLLSHSRRPPVDAVPLDDERGTISAWRTLALGASFDDPEILPMRIGASLFGAELSRRPLAMAGQRGFLLRFDFPLRITERSHVSAFDAHSARP